MRLQQEKQTTPRQGTFWTIPVIEKYSNIKSCHSSSQHYDKNGQLIYGQEMNKQELREKNNIIISRYQEIRDQLQSEAKQEYDDHRDERDPDYCSKEAYQDMLLQINYDVAWQIYDEVNELNDTE